MSDEQEQVQEQTPEAVDTVTTTDAPDWTPPTRDEWEKVTKALSERNEEAKTRRLAAEEAQQKAAAAEAEAEAERQRLLKEEGRWAELAEANAEKARRAEELEAQLQERDSFLASQVEALKSGLSEETAAALEGLPLIKQLALAQQFSAVQQKQTPAAPRTSAPATNGTFDPATATVEDMKDPQKRAQVLAAGGLGQLARMRR